MHLSHLTQLVHVTNLSFLSTQRIWTRAFLSETSLSVKFQLAAFSLFEGGFATILLRTQKLVSGFLLSEFKIYCEKAEWEPLKFFTLSSGVSIWAGELNPVQPLVRSALDWTSLNWGVQTNFMDDQKKKKNQFHGSTKRQKRRRKALISWSAGTTTILVVGRRKNNLFKHGR